MKKQLDMLTKFSKNKSLYAIKDMVCIRDGKMFSTDLEGYVVYDTNISGEGVFSLSEIKKVLTKYPDADIQIVGSALHVTEKGKSFKFTSGQIDDFPLYPVVDDKVGVLRVDKMFKTLQKFVANDELRPALSGVWFGGKRIAATDAHKLRILPNQADIDCSFIAPKSVFNLPDGEYTVYYNKEYIRFAAAGVDFYLRSVDATYPNIDVVIPEYDDATFILRVHTKAFSNLLDDCLMVANEITKQVILRGKQYKLTACDIDNGREYEGDIAVASVVGDEFDISFSGAFMQDCLYDVDVTEIRMFAPSKAMLIDQYTLLMPVMIKQ